ncbi:MAG: GTPase Era [Actinobacteria bacterium]|nr:GTPase Era [Actinomycetota bacterium]
MESNFKSGFIAVVGRPNVGKSTLINQLIKQKIVIISDKPQTTRNRVRCVVNRPDVQMVFIDTPGFHKPKNLLGEQLNKTVESTLREVDAVIFMVDASSGIGRGDSYLASELEGIKTPIILVLNKTDLISQDEFNAQLELAKQLGEYEGILGVSSLDGANFETLIDKIILFLPYGPKYYPDNIVTDQPERFIISEFIREKILELTREEIPHSVAVVVEKIDASRKDNLINVSAIIYVERNSQKGIIIGKDGQMIKEIGEKARKDIENLLGSQIFLELWVKVKKDWKRDRISLKEMGY